MGELIKTYLSLNPHGKARNPCPRDFEEARGHRATLGGVEEASRRGA